MDTLALLGPPEIIILLVIALIVFGPQKLPEIGRQVGAAMRELRKVSGEVQRALDIDEFGGSGAYDSNRWSGVSAVSPLAAAPISGTVAAGGDHISPYADYHPVSSDAHDHVLVPETHPVAPIVGHVDGHESVTADTPSTAAAH